MTTPSREKKSPRYLRIVISDQSLALLKLENSSSRSTPSHVLARYPVSTSKFGLGTEPGSYKTPLGHFVIEEKIGDGEPERMIFKSRQPTGIIASLGGEEDQILTRILWLGGLEPENSNTKDRFIYIHGTNQEDRIGTPASHGCIRLRNADMIALFDAVEVSDRLEILE